MNTQTATAWSYQVVEASETKQLNDSLTQLGADGWELVSVVFEPSQVASGSYKTNRSRHCGVWRMFFKRPA